MCSGLKSSFAHENFSPQVVISKYLPLVYDLITGYFPPGEQLKLSCSKSTLMFFRLLYYLIKIPFQISFQIPFEIFNSLLIS